MQFDISDAEKHAAKHPHELFLINLIFNHILMFVAFLSASSLQKLVILVPLVSLSILAYTLWRARLSRQRDPWYVMCHWQICARRSRAFILVLTLMLLAVATVMVMSSGRPSPFQWAILAIGTLPTMITVFALIIMESDSLHQARQGLLSESNYQRYQDGAPQPVESVEE
jgi:nicotinamide riboside transporter PnuC